MRAERPRARRAVGLAAPASSDAFVSRAGYVPPREGALGGLGLWIARQLATWLVIETDPSGGTVVRFGVERS